MLALDGIVDVHYFIVGIYYPTKNPQIELCSTASSTYHISKVCKAKLQQSLLEFPKSVVALSIINVWGNEHGSVFAAQSTSHNRL